MITVIFGDESRIVKLKEILNSHKEHKSFDSDTILEFQDECFSSSIFGGNKTLVLRRAEELRDLSILSKIPKSKTVIVEGRDDKGEFIKKIKTEAEKIECRESNKNKIDIIMQKLNISLENAREISSLISKNFDLEIVKLENFFYKRDFDMESAKKLLLSEEEVEVFKSIDELMLGRKRLAIEYSNKGDAMPFLYALSAIFRVMVKIKVLNIKKESYNSFVKTHQKFKKILPHPYFVFKNIGIANKLSLEEIEEMIMLCLEAESKIRKGELPKDIALLELISKIKI